MSPNTPPRAAAGPDQAAAAVEPSGAALVTLDGTASFDPDGMLGRYEWHEGPTRLATGPMPIVDLTLGIGPVARRVGPSCHS